MTTLSVQLPSWLEDFEANLPSFCLTDDDRMSVAVALAERNIAERTGGPFGAAIFDTLTGEYIAGGMNLVTTQGSSTLHAEIVALLHAQRRLGIFAFSEVEGRTFDLVASTEPCAMCYGATHWSGVSRLLCGARDEDARSIGFDEGPKLPNWAEELEIRGIIVVRDVLRERGAAVLRQYAAIGGAIYNG